MKTTSNRHDAADKRDSGLRPYTNSGAGENGSSERGSSSGAGIRPAAASIGAAALLAVLGTLPPAAEAATCGAVERGSLRGSTFTKGTSSTDNDYRVSCTGDASGKRVTRDDIDAAFAHPDADDI